MFQFADILTKAGLQPRDVTVLLHSPREGDLQRVLPGLIQTRRAAMEIYQASHSAPATASLSKGRPFVASFVKTGPGRTQGMSAMLFAGLYQNPGPTQRSRTAIETDPEVQWLHRTFGAFSELLDPSWAELTWFHLRLSEQLADLRGRLVLEVRLTPNYARRAETLDGALLALHQRSHFDTEAPDWRDMVLTTGMLEALPARWADVLRQTRGIYLIVDEADGARYVGSAAGAENILGRWRSHVAGDLGVTVGLSTRDPSRFRFSILERLSPDAPLDEVTQREQTWMARLHTVRFGLNRARQGQETT